MRGTAYGFCEYVPLAASSGVASVAVPDAGHPALLSVARVHSTARQRAAGVAVLDVIYLLATVALLALVGVIAKAVEKL